VAANPYILTANVLILHPAIFNVIDDDILIFLMEAFYEVLGAYLGGRKQPEEKEADEGRHLSKSSVRPSLHSYQPQARPPEQEPCRGYETQAS
jgi:hypothetical protein